MEVKTKAPCGNWECPVCGKLLDCVHPDGPVCWGHHVGEHMMGVHGFTASVVQDLAMPHLGCVPCSIGMLVVSMNSEEFAHYRALAYFKQLEGKPCKT